MDFNKCRNLKKVFITSQFSCCPLIWMFHSGSLNNKINRTHEQALRLVHENNLSFSGLLENSVTVYHKKLQVHVLNEIAPEIINDIFKLQNPLFSLRSCSNQLRKENIKTVHYGLQSVRYLCPKIWELLPNNVKCSNFLCKFKKLIRSWKPEVCPSGCVRHILPS